MREEGETRSFQQLIVRALRGDLDTLGRIGDAVRETHGLHPVYTDTRERALQSF